MPPRLDHQDTVNSFAEVWACLILGNSCTASKTLHTKVRMKLIHEEYVLQSTLSLHQVWWRHKEKKVKAQFIIYYCCHCWSRLLIPIFKFLRWVLAISGVAASHTRSGQPMQSHSGFLFSLVYKCVNGGPKESNDLPEDRTHVSLPPFLDNIASGEQQHVLPPANFTVDLVEFVRDWFLPRHFKTTKVVKHLLAPLLNKVSCCHNCYWSRIT